MLDVLVLLVGCSVPPTAAHAMILENLMLSFGCCWWQLNDFRVGQADLSKELALLWEASSSAHRVSAVGP